VDKKFILFTGRQDANQHQAITSLDQHFQEHNRGQLIMACGTGKMFSTLKIIEQALAIDLKKSLLRLPLGAASDDFCSFLHSGR
jgi:predicted helicase